MTKFYDALQDLADAAWWGALGSEKILDFTFLDCQCRMHIPYAHSDLIQKTILRNRSFYEHYLLLKIRPFITSESVVLDVGANIGNHTVFFSKVCGARQVYAFEPAHVAFALLEKNIEINNLVNVKAVNSAIGSREGRANLIRYSQTNIGGTMLSECDDGPYGVCTIDELNLKQVDFIKVDVESSEGLVLDGAEKTLTEFKPMLLVELLSDSPENPIRKKLTNLGYEQYAAVSKTDFVFR